MIELILFFLLWSIPFTGLIVLIRSLNREFNTAEREIAANMIVIDRAINGAD